MVLANSPFCFVNSCHVICKTIEFETSHLECKQQQLLVSGFSGFD